MKSSLLILCGCMLFASCQTSVKTDSYTAFNLDSVKTVIDAHSMSFSSGMMSGDSAAIVKDYAADAMIYPANAPSAKGSASMIGVSKQMKEMGATQFKVWSTNVEGNTDMVVEEGKWEIRGADWKDNGKFIVVWKRENGQWKITKDMWNSDNPPMPMKQ